MFYRFLVNIPTKPSLPPHLLHSHVGDGEVNEGELLLESLRHTMPFLPLQTSRLRRRAAATATPTDLQRLRLLAAGLLRGGTTRRCLRDQGRFSDLVGGGWGVWDEELDGDGRSLLQRKVFLHFVVAQLAHDRQRVNVPGTRQVEG